MKAIQVRYLSATETKSPRVKAWVHNKISVTLKIDSDIDLVGNVRLVAIELLKRYRWQGTWLGSELPKRDWCFVCIDNNTEIIVGI
jgi:hypothetical protein